MRWLFLLALTACTTFEPVARNTCGNGVLEPGEDCDSSDATCVHCAVTCTKAADCPNDAYTCGVDAVCHAPGGALGPAIEAGQFFVDDMRITDIDHDGIGDVVGASRTSLVVRHGDQAGTLARTDAQFTPSQAGPASFADLDNDGSLDVTIAAQDGLVSYASPYGVLSPLDIRDVLTDGATGMPLDARMVFSIPPTAMGAFVAQNGFIVFEMVDLNPANGSIGAVPCGAIDPANFSPDLVDVYEKNNETIVALTSKNGGKLCVLDVNRSGGLNVAQLTGANAPVLANKPVLADLDNDGDYCPDVITSEGGPGALMHRNGTAVGGHCTLGVETALPPITQLGSTDPLRGHISLSPVPLGVVPDALVFEDSIWGFTTSSQWGLGYSSPRPIAKATEGDLDGDGMTDVLLSAEGTDDIDILYRSNALFASFDTYRLDTVAPVTNMALGDFDDDGNVDIDYTERVGGHVRMMVAYGAGSRPTPPVEVGTFADVVSLAPIFPAILSDSHHQLTDMIVLSPALNGGAPAFTFLLGSAQRTLLPILDPRPGKNGLLRSAIVASYTGDPAPDIFAMATYLGQAIGWQVAGPLTSYMDTKRPTFVVANAADCAHAGSGGGQVCVDDALYITWPGSPQHDVVLEVDHEGHAMAFDPAAAMVTNQTMMTGTLATTPVAAFAGHAGVHTLARVDLDGSGTPKLLAAFDDAVLLCPMGASGVPTSTCTDVATMIGDSTVTCSDAATGHFGFSDPTTPASATPDLIALCHAGSDSVIYRIHDGTADVLLRTPRDLRALRAGDITGDGLDDIVAIAGAQGDQALVAFPQCSSRTLATCQLGAHR